MSQKQISKVDKGLLSADFFRPFQWVYPSRKSQLRISHLARALWNKWEILGSPCCGTTYGLSYKYSMRLIQKQNSCDDNSLRIYIRQKWDTGLTPTTDGVDASVQVIAKSSLAGKFSTIVWENVCKFGETKLTDNNLSQIPPVNSPPNPFAPMPYVPPPAQASTMPHSNATTHIITRTATRNATRNAIRNAPAFQPPPQMEAFAAYTMLVKVC